MPTETDTISALIGQIVEPLKAIAATELQLMPPDRLGQVFIEVQDSLAETVLVLCAIKSSMASNQLVVPDLWKPGLPEIVRQAEL